MRHKPVLAAMPWFVLISSVFCLSSAYADLMEQLLTPSDRIRLNEIKVEKNPSLRGRWDWKHREPASSEAAIRDNLAQDILKNFRKDPVLSEIPAFLKVRTKRGQVVLDGAVRNENEKQLVEDGVRRMAGVKNVENHLKVKNSGSEFLSD